MLFRLKKAKFGGTHIDNSFTSHVFSHQNSYPLHCCQSVAGKDSYELTAALICYFAAGRFVGVCSSPNSARRWFNHLPNETVRFKVGVCYRIDSVAAIVVCHYASVATGTRHCSVC